MFYKIIKKSSIIYKRLRSIRENELRIERENRIKVEAMLGFPITKFVGRYQQATFERVTTYSGFIFPDGMTPDPKAWRPSKEYRNVYVPNQRTKEGRNIVKVLRSLETSVSPLDIWEILGVENYNGSFNFPRIYLCGNILLVYIDEQQTPNNPDLVEITKTEFDKILKKYPEMNH